MKKRTLPLLMLIAGLSAAALAACGDEHEHKYEWKNSTDGTTHWQECECGDKINEGLHVDADSNGKCDVCDAHVHNYVWKSDAVKHWQECSYDGSHKLNESAHVDVKNNDTNANLSDYKCDDCGREATVRFNMQGHGVVPAQYIAFGDKAKAPETPADDDAYKFSGWYTDADCTEGNEFDFDKAIDKVTTVYSKWDEDRTPGASKKYAYELTKATESLQAAKPNEVVFFQFTAATEGRFTVGLGTGANSENSTFTTTLTGSKVYGKDCDLKSAVFDLDAGQTVYVMFSYLGEGGNDATAGVLLDEVLSEPLPEDYFLVGEYYSVSTSVEITNRTNENSQTLVYDGTTYNFKYVGGKLDRIYFVNADSESGDNITYYLAHNADGTYTFSSRKGSGKLEGGTVLELYEAQDSVALEKVVGYYKPEESATDGITDLYIYASNSTESTSVLIKQNGIYHEPMFDATYNTQKNRLAFGNYVVTLNLASDGSVESINVGSNKYVLNGAAGAVPEELTLADGSPEYYGTDHAIRTSYGSYYFGAEGTNKITVVGYADGTYTVAAANAFYKLTVSQDKETVTLYSEDGTLLDTLTLFAWDFSNELPATSTNVNVAAADFQKNKVALFTVATAGWYTFEDVSEGVTIRYGLNDDPLFDFETKFIVGEDAVYLEEDTIVGVFMATPAAVSFTVAPSGAAAGWVSTNPKVLVDGAATITGVKSGTYDNPVVYYFSFTAPAEGDYLLYVYYDDGLGSYEEISFIINDDEDNPLNVHDYGEYDCQKYVYLSATEENLDFTIAVTAEFWTEKNSLTVNVVEDYSANAADVTLSGTPANDSLTLSAPINTGANYHLTETNKTDVTATASVAFTVKTQNGVIVKAELKEGVYTAKIPADTDYFTVTSVESQTVTLSQTFAHGDIGYPIAVSATAGANTITIQPGSTTYFTLPAGRYTVSANTTAGITLWNMSDSDNTLSIGGIIKVEENDILVCMNNSQYYAQGGTAVTFTFTEAQPIFTAAQAGLYKGEINFYGQISVVIFEFDRYGGGVYDDYNISITAKEDGTYSFKYGFDGYFQTVTFFFGQDGNIHLADGNTEEITMEKMTAYKAKAEGKNITVAISQNGKEGAEEGVYVYNGIYIIDDPEDATYTYEVTFTAVEGGYDGAYEDMGDPFNLTITTDGDDIIVTDDNFYYSWFVANLTLKKQ